MEDSSTVGKLDGIYSAFFSSKGGEGGALLLIQNGLVVGSDLGGAQYDGSINSSGAEYDIEITVRIPPSSRSVFGFTTGVEGLAYTLKCKLPRDFGERPFNRIETPYGPINARFSKLRALLDNKS